MKWLEFKEIVEKELGENADNMEVEQIYISRPKHEEIHIKLSGNSFSIIDDESESFFYDIQG